MIYTAIDTFYLTLEELSNSPSRKDGIDEATETTLRIYGCDLIQESGILLRLPQAVMATGQVLFHRFYCKKSFARFNVKRVAASCVWLASKLEENFRKGKHVLIVFHKMECRRENLLIEHLDFFSKKYSELKKDLDRTERHLLKEMGFICHVEHPHKFISNYLATLEAPPELRQEAWNLANDSLRTTLCVRFKSEVVACGVVYAAARRFSVPLPENPPWWIAFDADKSAIDEVCRVLAHLYSLPKAHHIPVCKSGGSHTLSNKTQDSGAQRGLKEGSVNDVAVKLDTSTPMAPSSVAYLDSSDSKDPLIKLAMEKLKESKKIDGDTKSGLIEEDNKEVPVGKLKSDHKTSVGGERSNRERDKDKKPRDRDRGKDFDREREGEKDRDIIHKERSHRSKDKGKDTGHSEKSRHHHSRDYDEYQGSSYSSREKDQRHRHHPY